MSRRLYPHNRVRYWYSYDLDDICILFADKKLHVQTIRKWINKDGLKTNDAGKPLLVYGYNLIKFLKQQNSEGKCETVFDHVYCMTCHDARPIFQNKVSIEDKNNYLKVCGICRECKTSMFKNYKMEYYGELKRVFYVVDVLQLYDCSVATDKTHIHAQTRGTVSESLQRELFL